MLLKTIVIEDEPASQNLLKTIIQKYCPRLQYFGTADALENSLQLINDVQPDLIFMDIELKGTNGFEILDNITDVKFKIIFTTAYQEYALKAFKYNAIDYLLKPYAPRDVIKAVDKVKTQEFNKSIFNKLKSMIHEETVSKQPEKISIFTADGIYLYNINEIIRLEADGPYCKIYFTSGKHLISSNPLKIFVDKLPETIFFRIHASHLINIHQVTQYKKEDGGYAVLSDGTKLPISRRNKQLFIDIITNN